MRLVCLVAALVILPLAAQAADAEKGKTIFAQKCASCHGTQGAGDGPAAAALPPAMKPRNLQEGAFKVATDDAKMKDLLLKGGPAFGLNPLMAPQVGMSDDDVGNVIAFVRALKK